MKRIEYYSKQQIDVAFSEEHIKLKMMKTKKTEKTVST